MLAGPGTGKKGEATPDEMNHRFVLLARHDWDGVKAILEGFDRPAEVAQVKPPAEAAADAARRASKAISDGQLSRAHARAASVCGRVTPQKGVTNHEEIVSAVDTDVSIDEQVAKIIAGLPPKERDKIMNDFNTNIDPDLLQKAVWAFYTSWERQRGLRVIFGEEWHAIADEEPAQLPERPEQSGMNSDVDVMSADVDGGSGADDEILFV